MELRVRHCTGCEACAMAMARGKEPRCAIKDDDVEWILEKVLVEDGGLIVSTPVYHLKEEGDRQGKVSNHSPQTNPGALELSPFEQPNRNAFFGNPFMES